MASPGDKKGQRRGSCGHVIASFNVHDKCARCRDKLIGEDDCVLDRNVSYSVVQDQKGQKGWFTSLS